MALQLLLTRLKCHWSLAQQSINQSISQSVNQSINQSIPLESGVWVPRSHPNAQQKRCIQRALPPRPNYWANARPFTGQTCHGFHVSNLQLFLWLHPKIPNRGIGLYCLCKKLHRRYAELRDSHAPTLLFTRKHPPLELPSCWSSLQEPPVASLNLSWTGGLIKGFE